MGVGNGGSVRARSDQGFDFRVFPPLLVAVLHIGAFRGMSGPRGVNRISVPDSGDCKLGFW